MRDMLGIPVRIGAPSELTGLSDSIDSPPYRHRRGPAALGRAPRPGDAQRAQLQVRAQWLGWVRPMSASRAGSGEFLLRQSAVSRSGRELNLHDWQLTTDTDNSEPNDQEATNGRLQWLQHNPEPHALIKVVGVRRRRLERGGSHDRGWRAGRRVHHGEHRRAGADALAGPMCAFGSAIS